MKTRYCSGAAILFALGLSSGCDGLLGLGDKKFEDPPGSGGGTASSGGGGGTGGGDSGGAGGAADPLKELSDDFDYEVMGTDAISKAHGWEFAHVVEGYAVPAGPNFVVGVGGLEKGKLAVKIRETFHWIKPQKGFLMYRVIEGDFLVETDVYAKSATDQIKDVTDANTAAGLMVRKPPTGGEETWASLDRGKQTSASGSGVTITSKGASTNNSLSGTTSGRLAICRFGGKLHFLRNDDLGAGWEPVKELDETQAAPYAGTVQVGALAYEYNPMPDKGLLAFFDYLHFSTPHSEADCTPGD
jgi:hypothetical protein